MPVGSRVLSTKRRGGGLRRMETAVRVCLSTLLLLMVVVNVMLFHALPSTVNDHQLEIGQLPSNSSASESAKAGNDRLWKMLQEAAADGTFSAEDLEEMQDELPRWDQVKDRMGVEGPVILGLERCEEYRKTVQPVDRFYGTAGAVNSGTNLLSELMIQNCYNKERQELKGRRQKGVRWQVNWGKHQPPRFRLVNYLDTTHKNEDYFVAVTVRHPYAWMQSMCRHRYSVHWFHNHEFHCPNLVPNDVDLYWYNQSVKHKIKKLYKDPWEYDNMNDLAGFQPNASVVPVKVRYKSGWVNHTSLAHMWGDWIREYVESDFPRLVVRLEDLVFHPKAVITEVCHCFGGTMEDNFTYVADAAKKGGDNIHGPAETRTGLIKYVQRFVTENRTKGMTAADLDFAHEHVDAEMMQLFGYHHP